MVSACLIGQFGRILWEETSDGVDFFLVRATKKIKTVLDHKKCLQSEVFFSLLGGVNSHRLAK